MPTVPSIPCCGSCATGGFYLVDYWYWNGSNFDPFIGVGEAARYSVMQTE